MFNSTNNSSAVPEVGVSGAEDQEVQPNTQPEESVANADPKDKPLQLNDLHNPKTWKHHGFEQDLATGSNVSYVEHVRVEPGQRDEPPRAVIVRKYRNGDTPDKKIVVPLTV